MTFEPLVLQSRQPQSVSAVVKSPYVVKHPKSMSFSYSLGTFPFERRDFVSQERLRALFSLRAARAALRFVDGFSFASLARHSYCVELRGQSIRIMLIHRGLKVNGAHWRPQAPSY